MQKVPPAQKYWHLANMFSVNITFYYLNCLLERFLLIFVEFPQGFLQMQFAQKQTLGEINFILQFRQFILTVASSVVELDQGVHKRLQNVTFMRRFITGEISFRICIVTLYTSVLINIKLSSFCQESFNFMIREIIL